MRVEIDKSIFEGNGCSLKEFQRLLDDINMEGRHQLKIVDPSVFESRFFDNLSSTDRQYIEECFDASINETLMTDCLIRENGEQFYSEHIFNVQEGHTFLTSPVEVWLENSNNDSCFIKALIRHFRPNIPIDNWLFYRWIKFENAGGCTNARNAIESELNTFQGKAKMLRCFVLLDSDKQWPGDATDKYNNFIEFCNLNGITYHILNKRAMENYLPDSAFDEFRCQETNSWINAYLSLSPEQKDFLSIAGGFNANIENKDYRNLGHDGRQYMRPEVQRLYLSVSDSNYEHLERGISISNFKTQFPKKFEDSPAVFANSLKARTSHQTNPDELIHIVEKIIELM